VRAGGAHELRVPSFLNVAGASNVVLDETDLGADDFAFYQLVIPGFHFILGVYNEAEGAHAPLHARSFDVDEGSLVVGVKAIANLDVDFLAREAKEPH
jgi:metal-dependent amidase/aminoacylase/carboxypeptidase family protein